MTTETVLTCLPLGLKHSHGCVNLPPADAKWIYDWTTPAPGDGNWTAVPDRKHNDIGTWVWVHG